MPVSEDWHSIIHEITSAPGVVMIVGAVDTGKTHFCLQLCNAGVEAGISTAIVDADVGQSEIGAPGTIGMAIVDKPIELLSDLKPKRLYFVGSTTPADHLLECAIGTKKMVDAALGQGTKLVVVDTTGLVGGWLGRKLKTYKTDLIRPDYLVGIEKRREIEHLLIPFAKLESMKVRRAASPEEAHRKPPEFRTSRRRLNYYKHFAEAHNHILRMDDISLWNTWLGAGRPMKWQYMKFIEDALRCPILHVEVTGRGIFIVSERPCSMSNRKALEEQFKTTNITTVTGETFHNVLVGLADQNANMLNVGLLQAVDFKHRFLSILSPLKTASPVRVVQFGSIRVTREGEELGLLKPGDL